MKQALSNLIGTDMKESVKRALFRYKNRNFTPYIVERTLYGTRFKFYVGNKDGESWYIDSNPSSDPNQQDWNWPEMEFVKNNICKENDVVLECGGHHGLTAVLLSKWIGQNGRLLTFEPNPDNVGILHKNLEINSAKNVQVIAKAVGAAPGKIMISHSSSNSYILKGSEHNGINVDVVTADSYLALKPTVLKIDVEGFEVEVLKGAQGLLKTLPKLVIEVHTDMIQRYGSSIQELLSYIDPSYKLWVQWEIDKEPVPYDRATPINHRVHLFAVAA
ncbi:FkbM family methyltransferase [Xanthocytophaga flava]|uniref:FkbM family methyltransferase n=1 Tax=Xanthocytophaga flava TaxID=3048013 RepID=UPI0028D0CB82|nr:FkbM family methyltransferase [Xanthocytophaga flavus]MDJ1468338.1 FkbM family methyltransferase [Xanthocytophaga flavus]